MGGGFAAGTAIRIESGRLEQAFAVGDVIAVVHRDGIVAHRVIHVGSAGRAGYLLTKGDARTLPDCPVHRDDIVGLVTALLVDGEWLALPSPPPIKGRDLRTEIIRFLFERHIPSATLAARAAHSMAMMTAKLRRSLAWFRG